MQSIRYNFPDGTTAIVCGHFPRPKPCKVCGARSERLCDGKVPGARGRPKGCNAPLCLAHATADGPDRDLCPSCCEAAASAAKAPPPDAGRAPSPAPPAQLALSFGAPPARDPES